MLNAKDFLDWRRKQAIKMGESEEYYSSGHKWINNAVQLNYPYMFEWLGVPVIQFPSDLLLIQEAIVRAKVNKVIEVGIARGGTTIFLSSILHLTKPVEESCVVGVDVSISKHTREAINESGFKDKIILIEGNSVDSSTVKEVSSHIGVEDRVLVILDSNHSMKHVYEEITLYSNLVSDNSYLIVMDTAIEYLNPEVIGSDKPWHKGNNPDTAIRKFMLENPDVFVVDEKLNSRSFPGASKGGFLKKINRRS